MSKLQPRYLPDRFSPTQWGGKGASLALLIRWGYAVPPTACFGIDAVQNWLSGLPEYAPALRAARQGDLQGASLLQKAILAAPAPESWAEAAESLQKRLTGGTAWPLLFRSSASVEDGAQQSFAGAFDSVVTRETDADAFWNSLRQVIASAFDSRALTQVLAAGLDPGTLAMAVVVQPLLDSTLSGVAFSRDPARPLSPLGRVHYHAGAGEALVQGEASGTEWSPPQAPPAEIAAFAPSLLAKVAKLERKLGAPVDVEWIWDGSQLWFVQCRPIADEVIRAVYRPQGAKRWSRALAQERFPEPMTSMGWTALQDAFRANLKSLDRLLGIRAGDPESMAITVRGVVYSDPDFFKFPADAQGGVKLRFSRMLKLGGRLALKALGLQLLWGRSALGRLLTQAAVLDALWAREAQALEAGWSEHVSRSLDKIRAFEERLPSGATASKVLALMDELRELGEEFMEPDLAVFVIKDTASKLLEKVWLALDFTRERFLVLASEFEGNRTLQMHSEWQRTAFFLRNDPGRAALVAALESGLLGAEAGNALQTESARSAWAAFVLANGHNTSTWDVARPTWSEDSRAQLALVRSALTTAPATAPKQQSGATLQGGWDRWALEAGLASARALGLDPGSLRARRLQELLESLAFRVDAFMRMDEEHHFFSGVLMRPSRKVLLLAGEILRSQGALREASDVHHLTLVELKQRLTAGQGPTLTHLVAKRRSELERASDPRQLAGLPEILGGEPLASSTPETGDGTFKLQPMSAGIAVGPLVWAEHPSQLTELPAGAILLTTTPNPAWTPWYPKLAGLICITGGSLSHGFVAARETGLPAVSGAAALANWIASSPGPHWVELDATAGRARWTAGPPTHATPGVEERP